MTTARTTPESGDVHPSDSSRFAVGTASHGRRRHIFLDTAITSAAFDRRALCSGVMAVTVVGSPDTRDWPADPFMTPIPQTDVTCARCWPAYERRLAAAPKVA